MNNDEYHADFSRVSKTMLNDYIESPLDYYCYYVARSMEKPKFKSTTVGSIVHDVLLEGHNLAETVAIYPDSLMNKSGGLVTSKSKDRIEFESENRYCLKPGEFDVVKGLVDSVQASDLMKHIALATGREQVFTWREHGMGMKCKPDWYHDFGDYIQINDLKVTSTPKPKDFWRTARRFRYWLQDSHYSSGLRHEFNKPVQFCFWVVEDSAPFRVGKYKYNPDSRENAAMVRDRHLVDLCESYDMNAWQDEWTTQENDLIFDFTEF